MSEDKEIIPGASYYVDTENLTDSPYGVTQGYKRANYENHAALKRCRDTTFGDNESIEINGNTVYRTKKLAIEKTGDEYTHHSADIDHKDSLKEIHSRHKADIWISDEDIKEIANRQSNLEAVTAHDNRSKGARSDIDSAIAEKNVKKLADAVKVKAETEIRISGRKAVNITHTFVEGAYDALSNSVVPLIVVGVDNLIKVANGEKDMKDAVKDIGGTGVSIVKSGGELRVVSYAVSGVLKKSENNFLQMVAKSNQLGTILIVGSIVARATGRYIDGEITGGQFFEEISDNGLKLIAGIIGGTAGSTLGGPWGAAVGTIIASTACTYVLCGIQEARKRLDVNKMQRDYLQQLDQISAELIQEIKESQDNLREIFVMHSVEIEKKVESGFQLINDGSIEMNMNKVADGLDQILLLFDSEVLFKDANEVRQFMAQSNRVITLT